MTPAPTIRTATAADAETLALIGAATFLQTFAGVLDGAAIVAHCAQAHDPHRYRELMALDCKVFLAEVDPGGAPVGYAVAGPSLLAQARPGEIDLKRIYVLDRWQGSGLGAALLDRAVDHARTEGSPRLLVGAYAGNTKAQAFYSRNGFERIGERVFTVGPKTYQDVVFARNV